MKNKIKIWLIILCGAALISWYDPILDLFTRATTASIDTANDWLLFHDVTDGQKKKTTLSTALDTLSFSNDIKWDVTDYAHITSGGNMDLTSSQIMTFLGLVNFSASSGNITTITASDSTLVTGTNYKKSGTANNFTGYTKGKAQDFYTNAIRRFSIGFNGIPNAPASTKALMLSADDSLQYKILQSDGFGSTVTQSGSDTLLNSALNYGHFQRVGDIVTFTVRIEIALVNTGAANTVYFDPPIASNFTTASTDVIGTASMDSQGLSSANTAHQRCLLFASDTDDKIGISFDPVASLSYPENRMYISASGSYIIQ